MFDTRGKSVRPNNYVQQRVPPPRHAHTNLNHRHQPTDTIPGMHNTLLVLRLHEIYTCASQRRSDHLEIIYNAYRGAGSSRVHWHLFSETSRTPPRPSSQHTRSKHMVKKEKNGSVTHPPPPPPKSNEAASAQATLAPSSLKSPCRQSDRSLPQPKVRLRYSWGMSSRHRCRRSPPRPPLSFDKTGRTPRR